MKIPVYVDRLFQDYEDTPELLDFKEEIAVNLEERVRELEAKGLTPEAAFDKAVAELGDITKIADQISKQKRNQVISAMYVRTKPKLDNKHVIGYVASAGVALFGVVTALITGSATGQVSTGLAVLIPFLAPAVATLVFLGLTQETRRNMPMPWKRALLYGGIVGMVIFGIITSAMLYFMPERDLAAVFGVLIPFVIPGLCLITFLVLTEKSRHKPWVEEETALWLEHHAKEQIDIHRMKQRGMLSGALWLLSIAVFVTLGLAIGFQYSWVTFLFAIAGELLIEFWVHSKAA